MRVVVSSLVVLLGAGVVHARAEEGCTVEAALQKHAGQIVVLNYWAAWCGPCKKELPLLARLQQDYRGRSVRFLGASTDSREERQDADDLLTRAGVTYPIVYGCSEEDMRRLGLGSLLPVTAVFDQEGVRAFRLIGEVKEKRLVERLEWLLGPRTGRGLEELLLPPGIDRSDYDE